MKIKSWYEDEREVHDPEALEARKAAAIVKEAEWRANGCEPKTTERDIMNAYAFGCMGDELFALGEYIIQQHPDPEDNWWVALCVYTNYAHYYMMVNRPADAVGWFLKAFEIKLTYGYPDYMDLAAAYIESGDYEQADVCINKYVAHVREGREKMPAHEWLQLAQYYHDIDQPERAMAYMMEVYDETIYPYKDPDYFPLLAKIYVKLGEIDKGLEMYEKYTILFSYDCDGYAELALAYYELKGDLERSEANFLKAIEYGKKNWEDSKDWEVAMYKNLLTMYANKALWGKCFFYIRAYFQAKYEAEVSDKMVDMVDRFPLIENDEMGHELFNAVMGSEEAIAAMIRGNQEIVELPANPLDEVKVASKKEIDMTDLLYLGDDLSN